MPRYAQTIRPEIEPSWLEVLQSEFDQPYFLNIKQFLIQERLKGKEVYPPGKEIFNAFNLCPFDKVKVVLIGQDPYHGYGQAHGLSFSVRPPVKCPPSLQNIFKEIASDCAVSIDIQTADLTPWARQGVLLLNAILTVNKGEPASHKHAGWELFTNRVIQHVSTELEHIVFLLWGRFAQQKEIFIDPRKHLILKAAHPSPFSAHRGFFGCKHFSKANQYLTQHQKTAIEWGAL